MLGVNVILDIVDQFGVWVVILVIMVLFFVVVVGLVFVIFIKFGKYDSVIVYFLVMLGGLIDMILMGEDNGGDGCKIVLVYVICIFVVILLIGLFYGLVLGVRCGDGVVNWISMVELELCDWIILGVCVVLGVFLGKFFCLLVVILFGLMILSVVIYFVYLVEIVLLMLLVIIVQIVMGVIIGCCFVGVEVK